VKNDVALFITGFALLAVVYMLVRPGMPAAKAVGDVGNALVAMTRLATGWTGTNGGGGATPAVYQV